MEVTKLTELSETEQWKDVVGYEKTYQVSDAGRVKNTKTGRILRPALVGGGYQAVHLCTNGIDKSTKVHRIVCIAFLPNPENKKCVDHRDGNRTNNLLENLRWATSTENSRNRKKSSKNSSGFVGVSFSKEHMKWIAQIRADGKNKFLGYFDTAELANKVREAKARDIHGEFYCEQSIEIDKE